MSDELRLGTITAQEANAMTRPFEFDLEAVFRAMRQEAVLMVHRAVREGWSPEQLVENIGDLVTEPGFHAEESERTAILRDLTVLLGGYAKGHS